MDDKVIHIAGPEEPGNQQHCSRCRIAFKAGYIGADGWAVGARVVFVGTPPAHEEIVLEDTDPTGAVDCVAQETR